MPFIASDPQIVRLDYDFRPYVEAFGTTPEPTEDMIYDFQAAVRNVAALLGRVDVQIKSDQDTVNFMRSLSKEEKKQVNSKIFEALAVLTQDQPSHTQLMELNQKAYRLAQAYLGSLMGDLLNPKLETNVTSN
jgi:hypothetical protein